MMRITLQAEEGDPVDVSGAVLAALQRWAQIDKDNNS